MKQNDIKDLFMFALFEQLIGKTMEWLITTTYTSPNIVIQIQQNIFI